MVGKTFNYLSVETMEFDQEELLALAQYDMEQGQLEAALRKLKQIVDAEGAPAIALATTAKLYARLRLFRYAKVLYERYLEIEPDSVESTFELGMVNFDLGNTEAALGIWSRLLKSVPVFPPALYYSALVQSREGKIADAKRHLDVLLQTAQADNLYYEKGKELRDAVDAHVTHQAMLSIPINPYTS